jgi:hypothetical protein
MGRPLWARWLSYEVLYNITSEDFRVFHENILRKFIPKEICQDNAPLLGFAFVCPAPAHKGLPPHHCVVQTRPPMLIATYGVKAVMDQAAAVTPRATCTPAQLETWFTNESELVRYVEDGSGEMGEYQVTHMYSCKLGTLFTRLHLLATWCCYDGAPEDLTDGPMQPDSSCSSATSGEDEDSEMSLQTTDESQATTEREE